MVYDVEITSNVRLTPGQAEEIVSQVLKEDFPFLCQEVHTLQRKTDLKPHEAEDLKNDIEVRDAMKVLLRYYLTYREYTEYMELQRVYGNV